MRQEWDKKQTKRVRGFHYCGSVPFYLHNKDTEIIRTIQCKGKTMKQKYFSILFGLLIITTVISVEIIYAQTTYDVPVTLSLTTGGVDRVLSSQWNTMTHSWSDSYSGLEYSISLDKPKIVFIGSEIRILLKLRVQYPGFDEIINLLPKLILPYTAPIENYITTRYADLHQEITTKAQHVDSRIQSAIEDIMSTINWVVYQGKILTIQSQNSFYKVSGSDRLVWNPSPTLSASVSDDKLNITIISSITVTE